MHEKYTGFMRIIFLKLQEFVLLYLFIPVEPELLSTKIDRSRFSVVIIYYIGLGLCGRDTFQYNSQSVIVVFYEYKMFCFWQKETFMDSNTISNLSIIPV